MELSLRDLADRSGVSAPMLSQVERGETSPTLAVAARIASGLELHAVAAAAPRRGRDRRDRPRRRPAARHERPALRPPGRDPHAAAARPARRAVAPRARAADAQTGGPGDPPMHEPGSRESALVQTGSVVLQIDGERYELAAGDCVTFDADLPHHFENPGSDDAVLLAVVSAGLRRS